MNFTTSITEKKHVYSTAELMNMKATKSSDTGVHGRVQGGMQTIALPITHKYMQ